MVLEPNNYKITIYDSFGTSYYQKHKIQSECLVKFVNEYYKKIKKTMRKILMKLLSGIFIMQPIYLYKQIVGIVVFLYVYMFFIYGGDYLLHFLIRIFVILGKKFCLHF